MRALFPCLIFTSFLIGCGGDPVYFNVERVIVNRSSLPVVWNVYAEGLLVESVTIAASGEDRKKEKCKHSYEPSNFSCDLLSGIDIELFRQDSISIEYTNLKREMYCVNTVPCGDNIRNISLVVNPIIGSDQLTGFTRTIDSQKTRVYTFTITEQDYQNAKPNE
jgi:hypothetical protein